MHASVATPSADIYETCRRIHKRVLRGFEYISDREQWGRIEDWRVPPDVDSVRGDCDDYALACCHLLREAGLPGRLVVCRTETGEAHLVAVCGNYVLDNRFSGVKTKEMLTGYGYGWLAISGTEPGDDWHLL